VPTWNRKRFPQHTGCTTARVLGNPAAGWPFLIAHWHEAGDLPTVLTYGHADVILAQDHRRLSGPDP
jgi:acetylornithine deacetylase/succinyl-diaminopimelate desuccinylase-like protein